MLIERIVKIMAKSKILILALAAIYTLIFTVGCGLAADAKNGTTQPDNDTQDVNLAYTPPVDSEASKDDESKNNVVTNKPPALPEASQEPVERLGFSGGNIGVGGLICGGDDGYIYFRSERDWKLYRAKPDGSEKMKISDHMIQCINVLDGWVYFKAFSDAFAVYRVRTDGTVETRLADGGYGNLFVAESGMYFETRDESNTSHIYRADLDGNNVRLLFSEASLMYYYKGKIYIGAAMLGVYDIETGEEKVLDETYIHDVTVDESGIYYWAVEEGEFRRMDHDGSNRSVVLRGGDFFNYTNGYLYYYGISENANGLCYVINRLDIKTGETETLFEELNEYFDELGNLIGVTFSQRSSGDYAPDIFEMNSRGEMLLKGGGSICSESAGYVYVADEHVFMPARLRDWLLQYGYERFSGIARLDGGVTVWD